MQQAAILLNKGSEGKLRPLGCAATFRRNAYGALVRPEDTNLAKVLGPTQYAVERKAALESLSGNVLRKWYQNQGGTVFTLTSQKIEIAKYACEPRRQGLLSEDALAKFYHGQKSLVIL